MKTITLKTSVIPVIKRLPGSSEEQIKQFQKDFENTWDTVFKAQNNAIASNGANSNAEDLAAVDVFLSMFCDLEAVKGANKDQGLTIAETYQNILRKIFENLVSDAYKAVKLRPKMYTNLRIDDAGY